ncbi:MAG TPA: transposase [Terracidiphilus sp.]|nr:transposase [Terracidiphilus sp.]
MAKGEPRTFFVTTSTAGGRSIFQTARMAELLIDVLRSCVKSRRFTVHEFVVMPNHVHILLTIPGEMTLEKAMQYIKGGFSYRAGKELYFKGEVWQRGYSDVRIVDDQGYEQHRQYINQNPVRAGLADSPESYQYGTTYLKMTRKNAGAKAPISQEVQVGTTEVVP